MTWVWCLVVKINSQFVIDFRTSFVRFNYKMIPSILLQNGSKFSWEM